MAQEKAEVAAPTGARLILSALFVLLIVVAVWGIIEYRQKPPPPPNKIGARLE